MSCSSKYLQKIFLLNLVLIIAAYNCPLFIPQVHPMPKTPMLDGDMPVDDSVDFSSVSTGRETTSTGAVSPPAAEEAPGVELVMRDADLSVCPRPMLVHKGHKHISLGDLHGNVMKLIYTLIEEGFLDISERDYGVLNAIYNKEPQKLYAGDIDYVKTIVHRAKVNNDKSLTLIGDELAERGMNDFWMLLVLKRLHEAQVDMDILLSNHSVEFLNRSSGGTATIIPAHSRSYHNMEVLIANGIISDAEVQEIINQHYLPMVKALRYSISEKGALTIYTHAPVGLETVEALALKLGVDYDEKTPDSVMRTIDNINKNLSELFATGHMATLLLDEGKAPARIMGKKIPMPHAYPFIRLIWNRQLGPELRMKSKDGLFEITDVHGHVGRGSITTEDGTPSPNHQNMDNNFGKEAGVFHAKMGSRVEHFTRRSPDSPVDAIKYQLYTTLAEIKSHTMDASVTAFIIAQELLISGTTDKVGLLAIKAGLEGLLGELRAEGCAKTVEARESVADGVAGCGARFFKKGPVETKEQAGKLLVAAPAGVQCGSVV